MLKDVSGNRAEQRRSAGSGGIPDRAVHRNNGPESQKGDGLNANRWKGYNGSLTAERHRDAPSVHPV